MRIGICEDNRDLKQQLQNQVEEYYSGRWSCQIDSFESGEQLWFRYQSEEQPYDLLFLDIELSGNMDGLDVAREIRSLSDNVTIVILTAFRKYALAGYDVHPYKYLLKPVSRDKLHQVLDEIQSRLILSWNDCLNMPVPGGFWRLPYAEILFMESKGHYVLIHTRNHIYRRHAKLTDVKTFCDGRFLCCHKSYLVNADRIKQIINRYTVILLDNGKQIPISEKKRNEFIKQLVEYDRRYDTIRA